MRRAHDASLRNVFKGRAHIFVTIVQPATCTCLGRVLTNGDFRILKPGNFHVLLQYKNWNEWHWPA